MRKLYNWAMRVVSGPYALPTLLVIAFIESSFFPIPPDVLLIPLILAHRKKAFKIATLTTASSVIGGMFGYAIGFFLYEKVGLPILNYYDMTESFQKFCDYYNDYGAWIVFGAGLTPFPYKIVTIASGVTGLNLITFTVASVLSRGLRFFLIAWLLHKFGEPVKSFIEKNLGWLSLVFFALLVGCFFILKLL